MNSSQFQEFVLPSIFESVEQVLNISDALIEQFKLDEDVAYRFKLVVSEAVTNAIEHGNQYQPEKKVYLSVRVEERKITIIVKDEGSGFAPDSNEKTILSENLSNTSGRGVFLMQELANEFEMKDAGKTIRMVLFR